MPVIRIPEEIVKEILSNIPEDEAPTDEEAINLLMGCVLSLQEEVDDVKEALRALTNIMRTMNIMVAALSGVDVPNGKTKLVFNRMYGKDPATGACKCAGCTQQRLDDLKNAKATKDRAESPE